MRPCGGRHGLGAVPGCRFCWLFRHDERHRRAWWGDSGPYTPAEPVPENAPYRPPPRPTPCVHLGESLTGLEREALGLPHRLDWRRCGLGVKLGDAPAGVVCRCRGCGPGCAKYEAGG